MKCIVCGSEKLRTIDTMVSDFVMARIDPFFEQHHKNIFTRLCYCQECTFAFYEYRFTLEEESALYYHYRDDEYQKTREKYECWYTKKVNEEINKGQPQRQQLFIKELLNQYTRDEIKTALDYGGNQGATFYDSLGTEAKYVFDVSAANTLPGVISVSNYYDLKQHQYDFIMCNMVFEHLTDPYDVLSKLYDIGNDDTIYYIEVPDESLFMHKTNFQC